MLALSTVLALLLHHKYLVLFPIALVEGPIISILGGFLAASGFMNVYAVYAVVLAGDLIADTIYYALGRFGGRRLISRYGHWLWINEAQVQRLQTHFRKHTGKTLFAGKIAHGLGSVVLFTAGMGQVPYRKFIWWNFLSAALKSLILVVVGYYYGYAYQKINDYLGYATYFFIGGAVVLLSGYYFVTRAVRKTL